MPDPLPARVPPRQPAKDLATADTAPRGHGREMLNLPPQAVLLSDGQMEVGIHTHTHTQTKSKRYQGRKTETEMERERHREIDSQRERKSGSWKGRERDT